jgi:ABC-type antimicrobial peptide transport system permease subunit
MFLIENMIILLSSAIMGIIIGSYTGYFLETNMSLMTEMPAVFSIPTDTLFRVFILSISIAFIGTYAILTKYLYRKSIMDIFRQTF